MSFSDLTTPMLCLAVSVVGRPWAGKARAALLLDLTDTGIDPDGPVTQLSAARLRNLLSAAGVLRPMEQNNKWQTDSGKR